jgi:hypothetical protein
MTEFSVEFTSETTEHRAGYVMVMVLEDGDGGMGGGGEEDELG